ncbi:glycerol-3-phosphate dehydrogenase/oxidase [Cohnella endophytica]|uniref:Glycerol-3-phosphate dehydrogenase n=1 Tax=Cohnella endophytica TaxID=2419778 RepID=A0A494XBI4_9BACL|nr:glycerol-3-phosphate dehydrogenase/oxidase [Cohnella endophytica]RKP47372.1 glycerol-3-phosphate dehydrogenase/oxidase [Cohnella endophytica]
MKSQSCSGNNRADIFGRLQDETFDVLVIGGGITGAGIALDAASRGLRTAIVEMQDFAAGTSSRSTKLVHGGLRYLKQFEVKMVAEVGKERAIVYENGPHVTTPEWMLLPIYKGGTFGSFSTSIGLRVYDFLAGVKRAERREMLNVRRTLEKEPLLRKEGLLGGGYYVEYRTDDARLTIEVLKRAVELGATALNYVKVDLLLYKDGQVNGARITDQLTGASGEIRANTVVNATGPWVDTLRELDRSNNGKKLRLTKGVHLVIDQSRFPLRQAVYFDTEDKRMIFAVPRDGKTYVGTTDTFFDGNKEHPVMTSEDRTYLLAAINLLFPELRVTEADVESSWAGVRPLIYEEGKNPSEISRKDEIWESASGLITIAGGKLTGYRKMSELTVNLVAKRLGASGMRVNPCRTKHIPISGGDVGGSDRFESYAAERARQGEAIGLTPDASLRLARFYGSNADKVFAKNPGHQEEARRYGLPYELYLRVLYAVEEEMAVKPADFFVRRSGAMMFDIPLVRAYKENVVSLMKERLAWSDETTARYMGELDDLLRDAVIPVDLQSQPNAASHKSPAADE